MRANGGFKKLTERYLFKEASERAERFKAARPDVKLCRLGIGDATLPVPSFVAEAGAVAAYELTKKNGFRGYPPANGYPFLISAVVDYYAERGVEIFPDEVFISDGAKSDIAAAFDLLERGSVVALADPTYPAYADMAAIKGMRTTTFRADEENGFLPKPSGEAFDAVILCSPSNPTGAAYTAAQLEEWAAYASRIGAIIVFDAAYESFARAGAARSIYEARGAKSVAIEIGSLSKSFGFTGLRCGYTIVPRETGALRFLWDRRKAACFNGVSYVTQRMAEAALKNPEAAGANARVYQANAAFLAEELRSYGLRVWGGESAPYVWLKTNEDSAAAFERLLNRGVVTTPGSGFGASGDGFLRLSAFCPREELIAAAAEIRAAYAPT